MTVSTLAPKGYSPRLTEPKLDSLMQAFGCVEINGPKWCGKTLSPTRRETGLHEIASWCCRGGWPANLGIDDTSAQETAAQYIQSATDVNVIEDGRSPERAMALISALALNLSQAATLLLFGSGETLSCDSTQDIASSLLTQLCFKHQNISPRKKSLAWMILIPSASCSYQPWRTMTHFSYES